MSTIKKFIVYENFFFRKKGEQKYETKRISDGEVLLFSQSLLRLYNIK